MRMGEGFPVGTRVVEDVLMKKQKQRTLDDWYVAP